MNLHFVVLAAYSLALMGLGLWIGRNLRGASDFFVASRRLGPGLLELGLQLVVLLLHLRRSEEHTSELQSLVTISYAVFCLKKKKK